ncbi:Uncharacterised protein [Mannheimia haemolytica]|uniref:Uncharacterized protein n=1 Tax=Mannheimia haemolytica TaxID=75985 RepID=A0A378MYX9_MANHA|nr:Uncharacterised protein [Mannheimia haemolytica]
MTNTHNLDLATATPKEIYDVFRDLISKFHAKNYYSPVTLYVNYGDYFAMSTRDYSEQKSEGSILNKVMTIPQIAKIVPASRVPQNEILGLCKRSDVYQVLNGMPLVTRPIARHNETMITRSKLWQPLPWSSNSTIKAMLAISSTLNPKAVQNEVAINTR